MRVTFLGTGTSHGVPVIGCDCAVCRSPDPRNRRTRSSLLVEHDGTACLFDTPPDFREQALRAGLSRIDAVCFTHTHADHVFGLDDLRRFSPAADAAMPVYADPASAAVIRSAFAYVFRPAPAGTTRPAIALHTLGADAVTVGPLRVRPVPVPHGAARILGFRIDGGGRAIGYVPDCSGLPDEAVAAFRGIDLMVLDALRSEPHPTHLSLSESVALLRRMGARRSCITHLCHRLEHAATEVRLPPGMGVAYDGLTVEW